MIDLLPEPKVVHEDGNKTKKFKNLWLKSEQGISEELLAKGIILEDTREGVKWKRA